MSFLSSVEYSSVQMEAYSVEDDGEGVLFNVFVYNVQPGITIDYATGNSEQDAINAGYRKAKRQSVIYN